MLTPKGMPLDRDPSFSQRADITVHMTAKMVIAFQQANEPFRLLASPPDLVMYDAGATWQWLQMMNVVCVMAHARPFRL